MTQLPPQTGDLAPLIRGPSVGARIRNWFLTGVVVAGPLAVTTYIVWWFVNTIDSWVRGLVPKDVLPDAYLPFRVPGLGVVVVFLGLTLLGFLAANLAGRSLIRLGEAMLARMPVVRSIYKSVKQIFETAFSQSGATFRKVGLIEFPGKGAWSIVFISTPPGASHRRASRRRRSLCFGVPTLHAEPDHRLLLLLAGARGHRARDHARRCPQAHHVLRRHPARCAGRARGAAQNPEPAAA